MNDNKSNIGALVLFAAFASAGVYLVLRSRRSKEEQVPTLLHHEHIETNDTNMTIDKSLPRGYRNNNPLNVRYDARNAWLGKVMPNTDGAFEQFKTMAHGYRCALYLLRKYIKSYGCNTVRKIVTKWAPPSENPTAAYIQHVCDYSGLTPDMPVGANDRDTLTRMAYAMSIIENGQNARTRAAGLPNMETINQGWDLL